MPKHEIPPGHALIRLSDLAALLDSRGDRPPQAPGAAAAYSATWEGLAVATSMLTVELGGHQVSRADLAGGVSPEAVIGALVTVGAAVLRGHQADSAPGFLEYLGLIAASRGRGPGGEPL